MKIRGYHGGYTTEDEKQRQIALGYGAGKSIRIQTGGIVRWLDDGSVIEFTSANIYTSNAEFEINNDPNHLVWFSQLNALFIDKDDVEKLYTGSIQLKGTEPRLIRDIFPDDFWNMVKNKKFKVIVDDNGFIQINEKDERVQRIGQISEVCKFIKNKLDAKDYDAIKGMTKESRCYDLVEI